MIQGYMLFCFIFPGVRALKVYTVLAQLDYTFVALACINSYVVVTSMHSFIVVIFYEKMPKIRVDIWMYYY